MLAIIYRVGKNEEYWLLSDLLDNQRDNHNFVDSDSNSAHAGAEIPLSASDDGRHPDPQEMPLPAFNEQEYDEDTRPVFRISPAASPDLNHFVASEQPGESLEPTSQVYRVSPAAPDWSNYTLTPSQETPPAEDPGQNWRAVWAVVREIGETILLTLIIFFLIQTVIRNFRVVGTSMVDNLHDGQYLIIDKLSYTNFVWQTLGIAGPQRGDVIVFEPPNRPGEDYVKRIIGLPGERIEINQGQVFINGELLQEPFEPLPGTYTMPNAITVPPNQVFVLGDNRNNSNDSHNWGTLPIENIVGRAWISYWPPNEWGVIPRDAPTEQATLKYFLEQVVPGANAESVE
jgi:signal peptidase I